MDVAVANTTTSDFQDYFAALRCGYVAHDLSERATECFDLVAGRQWTETETSEMEEKLRVPVTFNRIQPTIDAVAGAEIQGRQQIQY